jgi:hypothetical protein
VRADQRDGALVAKSTYGLVDREEPSGNARVRRSRSLRDTTVPDGEFGLQTIRSRARLRKRLSGSEKSSGKGWRRRRPLDRDQRIV